MRTPDYVTPVELLKAYAERKILAQADGTRLALYIGRRCVGDLPSGEIKVTVQGLEGPAYLEVGTPQEVIRLPLTGLSTDEAREIAEVVRSVFSQHAYET